MCTSDDKPIRHIAPLPLSILMCPLHVDGLMAAGHRVHLANTTAIEQYKGVKHTDDESDARWLAHLLRLGILPEGYIYP